MQTTNRTSETDYADYDTLRVTEGRPYPLGATWDGLGVNFAIFSEHATKVELCLFDSVEGTREVYRVELPERDAFIWHGYIKDLRPGQLYGYRVYGPWEPHNGHRFNPNKVLVDPYAKSIYRPVKWDDSLFAYQIGHADQDLSFDERDSAPYAPLAAVVDPSFPWADDKHPDTPWNKTIIYEAHVKGLTALHPDIPQHLRGTYAGVAHEAVLEHLTNLGITALELMPVHYRADSRHLNEKGLTDYWGYNTLGFFAPDTRFCSSNQGPSEQIQEFKMMVRALHAAGIEVILDVVYNHTVEGNHLGPMLSFKGIDNASYYRGVIDNPRYYMDYTGCGNTLNMRHPRVLQLLMDSLRYWVQEMHVDGFRFDLASALARELFDVDHLSAFFDVIQQDPVISRVKLIAEPWDVGAGGYQVGNFPVLWTEWNGKYRDTVRQFVKGDKGTLSEMATRLTGSSDLYEKNGRRPHASINFVTAHDGFTLNDLVSFNDKHNIANGEDNNDGDNHNNSWNCGVEGHTDDEEINRLRDQQKRNFMAILLLSIGVPMLSGGDELSRSQHGNNNAYCQDTELSWYDWDLDERRKKFLLYVQRLCALRKRLLVINRKDFFRGRRTESGQWKNECLWLRPDGQLMQDGNWQDPFAQSIGLLIEGQDLEDVDPLTGQKLIGQSVLIICNASHIDVPFVLPTHKSHDSWDMLLDTSETVEMRTWEAGEEFLAQPRTVTLFIGHDDNKPNHDTEGVALP